MATFREYYTKVLGKECTGSMQNNRDELIMHFDTLHRNELEKIKTARHVRLEKSKPPELLALEAEMALVIDKLQEAEKILTTLDDQYDALWEKEQQILKKLDKAIPTVKPTCNITEKIKLINRLYAEDRDL